MAHSSAQRWKLAGLASVGGLAAFMALQNLYPAAFPGLAMAGNPPPVQTAYQQRGVFPGPGGPRFQKPGPGGLAIIQKKLPGGFQP